MYCLWLSKWFGRLSMITGRPIGFQSKTLIIDALLCQPFSILAIKGIFEMIPVSAYDLCYDSCCYLCFALVLLLELKRLSDSYHMTYGWFMIPASFICSISLIPNLALLVSLPLSVQRCSEWSTELIIQREGFFKDRQKSLCFNCRIQWIVSDYSYHPFPSSRTQCIALKQKSKLFAECLPKSQSKQIIVGWVIIQQNYVWACRPTRISPFRRLSILPDFPWYFSCDYIDLSFDIG